MADIIIKIQINCEQLAITLLETNAIIHEYIEHNNIITNNILNIVIAHELSCLI